MRNICLHGLSFQRPLYRLILKISFNFMGLVQRLIVDLISTYDWVQWNFFIVLYCFVQSFELN